MLTEIAGRPKRNGGGSSASGVGGGLAGVEPVRAGVAGLPKQTNSKTCARAAGGPLLFTQGIMNNLI